MKGSVCLIITRDQDGTTSISNTTNIVDMVGPDKWLVSFLNSPPFQRVVTIDEIQQWIIFPSQEAANNWIQGNSTQPVQDELPIVDPDDDQADAGDGTGRTNVEKRADEEAEASRPASKGKH